MKRRRNVRVWLSRFALPVALAAATPALAANIVVSNAWIRAMPAHLPAGGYFTVQNRGKQDVSLTGASSASCGMLMLHKSTNDNGMSAMMDEPTIEVPAGKSVSFAPGGLHLMCDEPGPAIKPGGKIIVELQFSDHTAQRVSFAVRNARGQ
jgi:copper(I)-binding protein